MPSVKDFGIGLGKGLGIVAVIIAGIFVIPVTINVIQNSGVLEYIIPESTLDTQRVAYKIHVLVNEQRMFNGLNALGVHPKLEQAATNHSQDMATRNYFDHNSPIDGDFSNRYRNVGLQCEIPISATMYAGGAENIFFLEGYYDEDVIAQTVVDGWMSSIGHRKNILTPYFLNEGIGVSVSDSGKIYITQNFC